jgi:hypothetical protein
MFYRRGKVGDLVLTSLISLRDQKRIMEFVEISIRTGATVALGVPPEMADGPTDEYGWTPWKPIDSPVGEKEIFALEAYARAKLPPLFRAYLMYKCLLMTDFGIIRLPSIPSDRPLHDLLLYVRLLETEPYWREHSYLPFGSDGNDGGPICFDTKRPTTDHDYPVVFVDRDLAGRPGYTGVVRWPSFAALLDVLQKRMLRPGQ